MKAKLISILKAIYRWTLVPFFCVLRFFNLLEPGEGIPGRDYFPILSGSKMARYVGLGLVVLMFLSGQPMDLELVVGLLTWVGGEAGYRFRQWRNEGTQPVDNPDVQGEQ